MEDPVADYLQKGAYREAISLCARNYGPALGRMCMALLGRQSEAEEVVQEALLAAYDGFPKWRGEASVRAWIFGIARKMCAKRIATRVRQERRLRLVHDAGADAEQPDEVIRARRRAERVRGGLERLKPSERESLVLRYQADLSYREIGEICDIDEAAARKRTSRALAKMRTILKDEVM